MPFQPQEKWDVHTHTTLSPDTFESLERFASQYAHFVRVRAHSTKPCCAEMVNGRGEVQRVIEDDAYHGPSRVEACDRHGVTVQVLSPTPMMIPDYVDNAQNALDICRILNDDNLRLVAQFPQRFVGMGALPMRFPDKAVQELERLKTLGFKGVEINSNVNGEDLDAPEFFGVFEAANDLGMAIFVHPWAGFMFPSEAPLKARMKATRNWRPWLAAMPLETALAFDSLVRGRVHERLPGLRVLYAHGGGTFPALLGRLEHGSYCRPDLFGGCSPSDMWSTVKDCGIYTDTLTHSPWALKMLVDLMGSRYLALGSDYPYPLGEIDPFDACTSKDPKGNLCPYHRTKNIYPGHLIEHLPTGAEEMEAAWEHFHWLPKENSDGRRKLPLLSTEQKENMLHRTAKDWLGIEEAEAALFKKNSKREVLS
jgi:aminocarboxymuconate-semialdehyde decarboxylase